jgi:hypothetical protein
MQRVKVQQLRQGLHPNEVIVSVQTADGSRAVLVVDKRSIKNDAIRVGYPIASDNKNRMLIELPREPFSGMKRVWVAGDLLVPDEAAAA